MASNVNVVSICNRALLAIGARAQISNLQEGSAEANACATLYDSTFTSLARSAYWNCLRQQATLTLLAAAAGTPENVTGTTLPLPPQPWLYSYALPSDCLQARYIVPTWPSTGTGSPPISPNLLGAASWIPGQGQIPFHVAYSTDSSNNPIQIILTNQTQAQLVYTVNQSNPQIWDSLFQEAMVASLSAFLAPALNLNLPLMQASIARADAMITQARIRDGDEGSTSQDSIPDWIRARNAGGGYNGYYGSYTGNCENYGNMYWPV